MKRVASGILWVCVWTFVLLGCGKGAGPVNSDSGPAPLKITTTSLPSGTVDMDYGPERLEATGGDGTYTWSAGPGPFPAGLTVTVDGEVSGTPRMPGYVGFTIQVNSGDGQSVSKDFSITIDGSVILASLGAGGNHTCGISTAGALYCWGRNFQGEVGDGTIVSHNTPVFIGAVEAPWSDVDAAALYTCGVTSSGAAYCWGDNTSGKLGNGTVSNSLVPVAVAGDLTFRTVSAASADFACGVTSDNLGYCWGQNDVGELGDGTTELRLVPTAVTGSLEFVDITTGSGQACGVTVASEGYCWGFNGVGQLGNGTSTTDPTASPQPVSGNVRFADISAGDSHTCGVTTDGAGYCWGSNRWGELGDGGVTRSTTPVPISGSLTLSEMSLGADYSCGLTTGGDAYCWGRNDWGNLGDGTTAGRLVPTEVSAGGLTFVSIVTGSHHTCALTAGGVAYCWGWNHDGQLGDATTADRATPVELQWLY
jgi:alpha-tubulin suppressor-like RCC1 family protein